ncbi:MAG: hypothetical protein M1816_002249 [Peltula sp. TS41687]|nr:MAG: hypothetical protein M1816_002249 [Peltula sp. TS41687]
MAIDAREVSPPPTKKRRTGALRQRALADHDDQAFYVFSWNVNGIEPLIQRPITAYFGSRSGSDSSLRTFLRRHTWPEVLCLQEVKIKPSDIATQRAVEAAANSFKKSEHEPGYLIRFCLPQDKHNAGGFGGKLYGVTTLIRMDVWQDVKRCRTVDWDREGRVLVLETKSKLAILNIYAVNGTDRPYKDPDTGAQNGTRHHRKLQFHRLLLDECLGLEKAGFRVIIAGDMNIARGVLDGHPNLRTQPHQHVLNRADFNEKFFTSGRGLQAIDAFRHIYGDRRKFTYYPRNKDWGTSCDRVDLFIVSKELVEAPGLLLEADILDSPQERSTSDHVPLYITLNRTRLFTLPPSIERR